MRDASRLIVGPNARLIGYSRHGYRKERLDIPPATPVPDGAAAGLDRRVDSIKVVCGDGDPARL